MRRNIIVMLTLSMALPASAQFSPFTFASPGPVATSDIRPVNTPQVFFNNVTTGGTITRTCASASNRLRITALTNAPATFILSDTQGLAASAATLGMMNIGGSGGNDAQVWNMACAPVSNAITMGLSGSGPLAYLIEEYQGLGTTVDQQQSALGNTTSCTVSGLTASQSGELAGGFLSTASVIPQVSASSGYSQTAVITNGTIYLNSFIQSSYENLNVASGSVPFSTKFATTTGNAICFAVTMPGVNATSPNYYPSNYQPVISCNSATAATGFSVSTGDLLIVPVGQGNSSGSSNTAPSSVTGSLVANYGIPIYSQQDNQGGFVIRRDWYAGVAGSSGIETVTANGTLNNPCTAIIVIHGQTGSGTPTNTSSRHTTASGAISWSGVSPNTLHTVTNNHSFVVACFESNGATQWNGVAAPFQPSTGSTQTLSMFCEWSRQLSSGSVNPSLTPNGGLAFAADALTFQ